MSHGDPHPIPLDVWLSDDPDLALVHGFPKGRISDLRRMTILTLALIIALVLAYSGASHAETDVRGSGLRSSGSAQAGFRASVVGARERPRQSARSLAVAVSSPRRISPARQHVVRTLDAGLAGTPMAHTGQQLEAAGWKWHVHPAFMAAVAGIEAAWGRLSCQSNRFNAYGLGSCSASWVPSFRSWAHSYDYYARFLRSRWPSASTPHDFHGYCVDQYGNDCPTWPSKVAWNMDRLGFTAAVEYGVTRTFAK